jgi:uncharacterized alpha-E superfamily protein
LARIASDKFADVVSTQRGGGSKDIWVLAAKGYAEGANAEVRPRVRSRSEDLPSRVGENLFWLGRYATRCEDKIRTLRATLSTERRSEFWVSATESCRQFGIAAKDVDLSASLFDTTNALGIAADLQRLQWSATQARSRLSSEHWRAIGVVQRQFHDAASSRNDVRETLVRLTLSVAALAGFTLDDMIRDDAWRLMMLGRRLERLFFSSTLLARAMTANAPTRSELEWLLEITSSTIAYRTRYVDRPRMSGVLQLLIRDSKNPRSIAFHAHDIGELLAALVERGSGLSSEFLQEAASEVIDVDFGVLEGIGFTASAARQAFGDRLQGLADAALLLSDRLSMKHFSHTERDLHAVVA